MVLTSLITHICIVDQKAHQCFQCRPFLLPEGMLSSSFQEQLSCLELPPNGDVSLADNPPSSPPCGSIGQRTGCDGLSSVGVCMCGCGVELHSKAANHKTPFYDVTDLPPFWRRKPEIRKFLPVFEDNRINLAPPSFTSAQPDKL